MPSRDAMANGVHPHRPSRPRTRFSSTCKGEMAGGGTGMLLRSISIASLLIQVSAVKRRHDVWQTTTKMIGDSPSFRDIANKPHLYLTGRSFCLYTLQEIIHISWRF